MSRFRIWQLLVRLLFDDEQPNVNEDLRRQLLPSAPFWREAISMANANYVTGALWQALRRRDLRARVSNDARDYLQGFYSIYRERLAHIRDQTLEVLAALHVAGARAMPMKGAAYMFGELRGYARSRFLLDIDILVPPDAVETGRATLLRLGYRPKPSPTMNYSVHHHIEPMYHQERPVGVELHRAAVRKHLEAALPVADVWRNASAITDDGPQVWVPNPTDAATIVFLHSILIDRCTARFQLPLRSFLDLEALDSRSAAGVDWAEIAARAATISASPALRRLAYLHYRLSSRRIINNLPRRLSDPIHFGICRLVAAKPYLMEAVLRIDRLSEHMIRERYGVGDGAWAVGLCRMKEIATMLRSGARRLNRLMVPSRAA